MCKEKLFTGIKVKTQMDKAQEILEKQVLPKEKLFQRRKRQGVLNHDVQKAPKMNA